MEIKRKKRMVQLTLDPELVNRLDDWIRDQPVPPPRNAVVETAIKAFLDAQDAKKQNR